MTPEYIAMCVVTLAWGLYPLVARWSGIGGAVGTLILTLTALVPITVASVWQGGFNKLDADAVPRLIGAGLLMGTGSLAFNFLVNSRKLPASLSIPIADTGMLLVSAIGAIVFFSEPFTVRKAVGVGLLCIGIIALKPD